MAASGYRYAFTREVREHFKKREDYLESKGPARFHDICQVLEAVVNGKDAEPDRRHPWRGFPWMTLVLGSGCLELPDQPGFSAGSLAAAVSSALTSDDPPVASDNPMDFAEDVRRFTYELVVGRNPPLADVPDEGDPPDVSPVAVRLVVLAYLLTRFFHQVRAGGSSVMSRWDDDVAELPPGAASELDGVREHLVGPALRIIGQISDDLTGAEPSDFVAHAVLALLESVDDELQPRSATQPASLRADHLRLLTEVAWHFLVKGSTIYPGWTDLLLNLMLLEGDQAMRSQGKPRPRFTLPIELPEIVSGLLLPPTKASWESFDPGEDTESSRDRFYESAAEVLWSQADALRRVEDPVRRIKDETYLPPASAFVTSFDMELDMALVARGIRRRNDSCAFAVALPVHLLEHRDAHHAEFCWLLGRVEPSLGGSWEETLASIRKPVRWELLTPDTDIRDPLRQQPVVIHLSGCPLYSLPRLKDEEGLVQGLSDVGVEVDPDRAELAHAVIVDEYLALRHSEAELFWTSHRSTDAQAVVRSRALHQHLTHDGDGGGNNKRFWMALGVPMADPAIRHRVAAQISLRLPSADPSSTDTPVGTAGDLLGTDPFAAEPGSDVDGLAVNQRIGDDEVGLLFWLGFDVVETDCRAFIDDLRHYAAHVKADGEDKRPPMRRRCRIT